MRVVPLLICLHLALSGYAQVGVDTLANRNLEEVVVTATRTERELGALPMPVTLVGRAQIKSIGSVRLQDVLTEQTGLLVVPQVNGQGSGLQLQGFNPDYTLILLDGEPIIGRYTGSLELSRIAVGNIRQIEIVKGPSSSLYGSDALAGVVNIITERPQPGFKMGLSARYGANETSDLNGEVGFSNKKFPRILEIRCLPFATTRFIQNLRIASRPGPSLPFQLAFLMNARTLTSKWHRMANRYAPPEVDLPAIGISIQHCLIGFLIA
jgi:outer membrane cobalamin receptor